MPNKLVVNGLLLLLTGNVLLAAEPLKVILLRNKYFSHLVSDEGEYWVNTALALGFGANSFAQISSEYLMKKLGPRKLCLFGLSLFACGWNCVAGCETISLLIFGGVCFGASAAFTLQAVIHGCLQYQHISFTIISMMCCLEVMATICPFAISVISSHLTHSGFTLIIRIYSIMLLAITGCMTLYSVPEKCGRFSLPKYSSYDMNADIKDNVLKHQIRSWEEDLQEAWYWRLPFWSAMQSYHFWAFLIISAWNQFAVCV